MESERVEGKHRVDVHRVARSRVCSPAVVVGGARFSRGDVPLRLVFRGGVDEAKVAASRGIMLQLLLAPMVLHSGATGEFGSCCTGVRAWIFVALQVMLLLPFCFKDAGCAAGAVEGGWLVLPRSSLGGGVRRRRAQI